VQNNDTNPDKLIAQVCGLRNDVIASSDTDTIEETANELLGVHPDLVRVLGTAFLQDFVGADDQKGIKRNQSINASSPLFGVQAASVFEIVQRFINSGTRNFKDIGHWFEEAQQSWNLIDKHGAQILQFENIEAIKNDVKILNKISKLWQSYMSAENAVASTDHNKAVEHANQLLKKFQRNESKAIIDRSRQECIDLNSSQKDDDFKRFITDPFEMWKTEPAQNTIQHGAEKEHIREYRTKMQVLKNDFELLLESKYNEGMLLHAHKHGLRSLVNEARRISQIPELA